SGVGPAGRVARGVRGGPRDEPLLGPGVPVARHDRTPRGQRERRARGVPASHGGVGRTRASPRRRPAHAGTQPGHGWSSLIGRPIMTAVTPTQEAGVVSDALPSTPDGNADLPLSGVRVIELGRFAAGPACATMLADWGAEVVKIEPPTGDPARGPGSVTDAAVIEHPANPRFDVHNRTRRGLVL